MQGEWAKAWKKGLHHNFCGYSSHPLKRMNDYSDLRELVNSERLIGKITPWLRIFRIIKHLAVSFLFNMNFKLLTSDMFASVQPLLDLILDC